MTFDELQHRATPYILFVALVLVAAVVGAALVGPNHAGGWGVKP